MILQQARISWLKVICAERAGCAVCRFAAAFENVWAFEMLVQLLSSPSALTVLCCWGWEVTWSRAGHCVGVRQVMGGAWCSHMMVTYLTDDLQIMPRVSNPPRPHPPWCTSDLVICGLVLPFDPHSAVSVYASHQQLLPPSKSSVQRIFRSARSNLT